MEVLKMKNLALSIYFVTTVLIIVAVVTILIAFLGKGAAVVDKATDPDAIIYNYEWFEQTYNDVLKMDRQILQYKTELQEIDKDKERELYYRKFTELSGLRAIRENLVSEYNAKSKMISRKMWKSKELPREIE